jgi:hypothetical protein
MPGTHGFPLGWQGQGRLRELREDESWPGLRSSVRLLCAPSVHTARDWSRCAGRGEGLGASPRWPGPEARTEVTLGVPLGTFERPGNAPLVPRATGYREPPVNVRHG